MCPADTECLLTDWCRLSLCAFQSSSATFAIVCIILTHTYIIGFALGLGKWLACWRKNNNGLLTPSGRIFFLHRNKLLTQDPQGGLKQFTGTGGLNRSREQTVDTGPSGRTKTIHRNRLLTQDPQEEKTIHRNWPLTQDPGEETIFAGTDCWHRALGRKNCSQEQTVDTEPSGRSLQ